MTTNYQLKEHWPTVPNQLEICQDAEQIGTTYERLAKHMVVRHKEEDWIVSGRGQAELEAMHDRSHQKTAARLADHTHAKPVRIVGFELKEEPPLPVLHKFPFKSPEVAAGFVAGLAVFGAIKNFLMFPKGVRSPIVYVEGKDLWVVTIKGDIPGFEAVQPDANNEFWHEV